MGSHTARQALAAGALWAPACMHTLLTLADDIFAADVDDALESVAQVEGDLGG